MKRFGVLALQGSFAPHIAMLKKLGIDAIQVRQKAHLEGLTHLILPGGESTTFRHLMDLYGLTGPLLESCHAGLNLMATCAGAILIGRADEERPKRLELLDAEVKRNAYGRQVDSFTTDLQIPILGSVPFHAVFIRAPRFGELGPGVNPIAEYQGEPVAVAQERVLAIAFHPELGEDTRLHRHFAEHYG